MAREKTREKIIKAFWELYEIKSIDKIRIKEITDIAKLHRATFYEYFIDIYDILEQEEKLIIDDIIKNSKLVSSKNLEMIINQITNIYLTKGKKLCILIGLNGGPKFIHKLKETFYTEFLNINSLNSSPEIATVYEFGINGLIMAFNNWYQSKDKLELNDFIKIINSIVETGIFKTILSLKNN